MGQGIAHTDQPVEALTHLLGQLLEACPYKAHGDTLTGSVLLSTPDHSSADVHTHHLVPLSAQGNSMPASATGHIQHAPRLHTPQFLHQKGEIMGQPPLPLHETIIVYTEDIIQWCLPRLASRRKGAVFSEGIPWRLSLKARTFARVAPAFEILSHLTPP